ncbi:hypothetical protein ACWD8L_11210 [Streptomyces sp. NPDC005133]
MAHHATGPAAEGPRTTSPESSAHPAGLLIAGPATVPLTPAGPGLHAGCPPWARTVPRSGIDAGALVAVPLNLFLRHLGTHGRTAVALKSS